MRIRTEFVNPPIPTRAYDWCAYDDDTYDGPGSIMRRMHLEEPKATISRLTCRGISP